MTKAYSSKALPPGTILREWRLEQVLGVGGFGIVYKGRGIYFDELVAIKEYFPSAISDRKDGDTVVPTDSDSEEVHALGLKKFVEEAKLLWNLSKPTRHPNIVSVRSLFEINGTAYMVMDFEDGASLSDLLKKRKKFSEASLMAILRPMAEGLDRAHRVGVLHRDIKPANILIGEDGEPVLIDFGSARFDAGQATSTKVTFHTPPYAAIEQYVKTYEQGPWTDIYALGVVLYECVTGTKPPEVLERMHGGLGHPLADGDWPDFSHRFLHAVDAAMTIRPTERPQSIPQWLALFDDEDAPFGASAEADEAPTRFAAFESPEIVPIVGPTPVADGAAEEVAEPSAPVDLPAKTKKAAKSTKKKDAEPVKTAQPSRTRPAAMIGGGLLVVAAAGAWLLWPAQQRSPETDSLTIESSPLGEAVANDAAATVGNEVAAVDFGSIEGLAPALDALARDARSAGRPGGEIARLADASARIRALAAEAKAAAAQPGSEGVVQAKVIQMNALAKGAAGSLAQGIRRDAEAKAKDIPASASGADAAAFRSAVVTVRRSASASGSPRQAIDAARRSLSASRQVNALFPKAFGSILPAKREEFASIAAQARSTAADVARMGRAKKPGLFASSERRDQYRVRLDNAAQAQAELAKLDQMASAANAVTSAASVDTLIRQAKEIQSKLGALQASSAAAMPAKEE